MKKIRKMNIFEKMVYAIKGAESAVVELLVTVGPWLAPATPAFMTYRHVTTNLGFSPIWGLTTAIAVEILGFASVHTIAKFYQYNKQERSKGKKIPLVPILFTFIFYLAIVMVINLALDWEITTTPEKMAIVSLILLSVPAMTVVATRATHTKLLMEKEGYEYEETTETVQTTEDTPTPSNGTHPPETTKMVRVWLDSRGLKAHEVGSGREIQPNDIAKDLMINPTSVRTALFRIRENEKKVSDN